ncbi:hypothetical protein Ocin01_00043, partial [Orchesella cincta]
PTFETQDDSAMRIDESSFTTVPKATRKGQENCFSHSPKIDHTKGDISDNVQLCVRSSKRSLKENFNMSNGRSNFFHHFIPKTMPCIVLPSQMESSMLSSENDHILNLSASLNRHCPIPKSPTPTIEKCDSIASPHKEVTSKSDRGEMSSSPSSSLESDSEEQGNRSRKTRVDMNYNDVKAYADDEISSVSSEMDGLKEDQMTDIDVGDHCSTNDDSATECGFQPKICKIPESKKSKSLTFGIDRILSSTTEASKDQTKLPTGSAEARIVCESPPVVPNLSTKIDCSAEYDKHHSIMTKLKLCTTENQKRSAATLPFFHHPYTSYHHHHNINSIITTSSSSNENRHHHSHHHHHPLSHCSECLFLRRYCGGSSGATRAAHTSSSSSSAAAAAANNVATNNMQFSSMATPCGPTSSPISASFTWMANPSIYDNSAIISPVAGMK